jgi:hypothetical protein
MPQNVPLPVQNLQQRFPSVTLGRRIPNCRLVNKVPDFRENGTRMRHSRRRRYPQSNGGLCRCEAAPCLLWVAHVQSTALGYPTKQGDSRGLSHPILWWYSHFLGKCGVLLLRVGATDAGSSSAPARVTRSEKTGGILGQQRAWSSSGG